MRKLLILLVASTVLAACSEDTAAPREDTTFQFDDVAVLAFGAMDMAAPGTRFIARLHALPDSIKLTPTQQQQVRSLMAAYGNAIKADLEALRAIHEEARAAKAAGKTDAEIRAIFAKGDPIRQRLHDAEAKLHADIMAILTPAQQAWVKSPQPHPCADPKLKLTDAQKTQITALVAAFQSANQADIDAVRKVHEEARAAHAAGATREQIKAILDKARAPMERVRNAQLALTVSILALLTPEQLTSGCFGPVGPIRQG